MLAPLAALHAADTPKPATKPNVVFILADQSVHADTLAMMRALLLRLRDQHGDTIERGAIFWENYAAASATPHQDDLSHVRTATWTEIFSPDLDGKVRNVSGSGVRLRDSQTDLPIGQVVKVIELAPNPDYPGTKPKGGTGEGIRIR